VILAATDPANPYGALLHWPVAPEGGSSLTRSVGARVVLVEGRVTAYMRQGNSSIQIMLPEEEPARSRTAQMLAESLVTSVQSDIGSSQILGRGGMLISSVNGIMVSNHPMARFLLDAGFQAAPRGFNVRRNKSSIPK
jgi:ATP-dependent Lhr-like helicase